MPDTVQRTTTPRLPTTDNDGQQLTTSPRLSATDSDRQQLTTPPRLSTTDNDRRQLTTSPYFQLQRARGGTLFSEEEARNLGYDL